MIPTVTWCRTKSRPGKAPTPEFLEKYDAKWLPYFNLNVGIGQGDLSLTPVQMLSVISLVANNGKVYRPHVARAFRKPNGTESKVEPEVIVDLDFPPSFWSTMREALFGVVDHGTAGAQKIEGLAWGGKTGSAQ